MPPKLELIKNDSEFTDQERSLIARHEFIFDNPGASECKICGRNKSPLSDTHVGGPCLYCIEEHLKARKAITIKHLPTIWPADAETIALAHELIESKHEMAEGAAVAYTFKAKHTETNGKIKLGSCAKQSPKLKMLHGWDYVIEIAWDMWAMMIQEQREALLLHELCHIFREDGAWKIEGHSVEEHVKVIEHYGLWKPDIRAFAEAIMAIDDGQEQLPGM